MDCGLPGSSVREISQARILEWVAIPPPGDLPDPGMESVSPALQEDPLPLSHQGSPAAAAKSLQSCPTLCDPIDGSPPGSAVPGILQARTLEWAAISFSKGSPKSPQKRARNHEAKAGGGFQEGEGTASRALRPPGRNEG